ncbi:MAG: segregation/condensation protein A [Candidatus Micrarchaeia archaeon]
MPSVEVYKGSVIDLEGFVRNATWREVLIELVDKNKLDPWDINIAEIADHYLSAVRSMKVLDLHVPANIILAASILLRMKSEMLVLIENEEPQAEAAGAVQRIIPEVPTLVSRLRLRPGKRITLSELIDALSDVMKMQPSQRAAAQPRIPLGISISAEDIDAKLDGVYAAVEKKADHERMVSFAELVDTNQSPESVLLNLFVPLLLLMHQGRLTLVQDSFFDEIFIMLNDGRNA